jgi:hypothetical protein
MAEFRIAPGRDGQINAVNPTLLSILKAAAANAPPNVSVVEAFSGKTGRATGTKNHPRGNAVDVHLYDANGTMLPSSPAEAKRMGVPLAPGFRAYEQFAQTAKQAQQQIAPNSPFRWGGYFVQGTPFDLMHFDVTSNTMAGGTWDGGLNPDRSRVLTSFDKIPPVSAGIGKSVPAPTRLAANVPLPNLRPDRGFAPESVVAAYKSGGEPAVRNMVIASSMLPGGTAVQSQKILADNAAKAKAWITANVAGGALNEGAMTAGAAVKSAATDAGSSIANAVKGLGSWFGGNTPPPPVSQYVNLQYRPAPGLSQAPPPPQLRVTGSAGSGSGASLNAGTVPLRSPQAPPFAYPQNLTPARPQVDQMNLSQGQQAAADRLTALAAAYGIVIPKTIPFTQPARTVATLPPRQSVQQAPVRLPSPITSGFIPSGGTGGIVQTSGPGGQAVINNGYATNLQTGARIRLS